MDYFIEETQEREGKREMLSFHSLSGRRFIVSRRRFILCAGNLEYSVGF